MDRYTMFSKLGSFVGVPCLHWNTPLSKNGALHAETMCRQASGESIGSFGSGDRNVRRSASGGEQDERAGNAWKAAGLHMARSVSESLD